MNQLKHLKTFSLRAALVLLVMMLTATTARALTVTCLYYDNASSSYLEGTVGGTYSVSADGTKLYVTPNPGYYLVSVKREGSMTPLESIAPVNEDPYYTVSASDVITITFKPYTNNVQVRFNMKNHGDAIANQNLTLGETVTRPTPDPTADGFVFHGWYTNSGCTTPYNFNTELDNTLRYDTNIDCYTLTLYAGWGSQNVRVSFDMMGHGTAPADRDQTLGETVTQPDDPTADGYVFFGWFTDNDCTMPYDFTTVLDNSLTYDASNERFTLTLHAMWLAEADLTLSGSCGKVDAKAVPPLDGSEVTWAVTKSAGSSYYDVLTISGSGAMTDYKDDNKRPWKDLCAVIKTIVIGEGVTTISKFAFQDFFNVTSDITIPASVISIGVSAFRQVSWNTAAGIHISASEGSALASIGEMAFNLANVGIDLSRCNSLNNLSDIYIFRAVTKDVILPSSMTSICKWAFNRFEANAFSGDHAYVVVPEGKALSVTIDGVTEPVVLVPTDGKADILGCLYVNPDEKRTLSRALTLAMVPATINLTANLADGNYWTTFYCGDASYLIDEGENATAYTAEVSDDNVVLHSLNKDIPKNTAVVIKGEDNEISMSIVADPDLIVPANALQGVDVATATSTLGEGTFYVLGKVGDNFGFHRYTGTTMPARKAYLLLSGSAAPSLSMVWGDEETTGMRPTPDPSLLDGGEWYDLSGRRLSEKPSTKGLYIHNGRKEVVK